MMTAGLFCRPSFCFTLPTVAMHNTPDRISLAPHSPDKRAINYSFPGQTGSKRSFISNKSATKKSSGTRIGISRLYKAHWRSYPKEFPRVSVRYPPRNASGIGFPFQTICGARNENQRTMGCKTADQGVNISYASVHGRHLYRQNLAHRESSLVRNSKT